jgi:hypothetical protein
VIPEDPLPPLANNKVVAPRKILALPPVPPAPPALEPAALWLGTFTVRLSPGVTAMLLL